MTRYAIAARQHGSAINLPPVRLVMHGTVSPCRAGQAVATGDYFRNVTRPASAHRVIDPVDVVVCLPDSVVGYHAPPNLHSLGYELCDPQVGDPRRWGDAAHKAMLHLAAVEVAGSAVKYGIPIRRLTVEQVRAGMRGICDHNDVRLAFGQTTHVDVGPGFPWDAFLADVVSIAGRQAVKPPSRASRVVRRLFTARLAVDGDLGPRTWARLATVLGLPDSHADRATIVRKLQAKLGVPVDGVPGPRTTAALQRRLRVPADTVWGPTTTKALQRRLNAGRI